MKVKVRKISEVPELYAVDYLYNDEVTEIYRTFGIYENEATAEAVADCIKNNFINIDSL